MESDAFQGWELLKEEYEPSMDKALISVQEKIVTCKMVAATMSWQTYLKPTPKQSR
jgi:hypothetical protein